MRRLIILSIITMLVIPLPIFAGSVELPKDQPTIEALISLHKLIKKEEDKALVISNFVPANFRN